MTSLARIVLEELAQVVVLPRAAIFLVDGQTVAYRVSDAGWDRVELKLGGLAPQEAEVLSGAAPGENFLLVAPEGDATPTSADGPATPGSPFGNGAGKGNHGK